MSWITVAWSMNAAACLTFAGIYFVVWCKQRKNWVHLLFLCIAMAAAAIAAFELRLIYANTPEEYRAILRWGQVAVWALVVSLVGFSASIFARDDHGWLGLPAA